MNRNKQLGLKYLSEGCVPSDPAFTGTVLRYSTVVQELKNPELTGGVQFRIEGRRMFMMA
jgi:hypothetical protein